MSPRPKSSDVVFIWCHLMPPRPDSWRKDELGLDLHSSRLTPACDLLSLSFQHPQQRHFISTSYARIGIFSPPNAYLGLELWTLFRIPSCRRAQRSLTALAEQVMRAFLRHVSLFHNNVPWMTWTSLSKRWKLQVKQLSETALMPGFTQSSSWKETVSTVDSPSAKDPASAATPCKGPKGHQNHPQQGNGSRAAPNSGEPLPRPLCPSEQMPRCKTVGGGT